MSQKPRSLHLAWSGCMVTKEQKAQRTQVVMAASWYSLQRLQCRLGPMTVRTLLGICRRAHRGQEPSAGLY